MILKINKKSRVVAYSRKGLSEIISNTIVQKGDDCNLNFIDTSRVTNMSFLFRFSNFNGDISEWDTSNVVDMTGMFWYSEFNGDISGWNTENVETMSYMFRSSKFKGDLSKWNTRSVKYMTHMFAFSDYNGIIGTWNVENVIEMKEMFIKNKEFSDETISNWKVNDNLIADRIFNGCKKFLNIPDWYKKLVFAPK